MKAIIQGKLYDTDTADELGDYSYSNRGDFRFWAETLYRTKAGAYFIAGEGGPMSMYARPCGQNETAGGEVIRVVTEADAREWMERNCDADAYIAAFGEPEGA